MLGISLQNGLPLAARPIVLSPGQLPGLAQTQPSLAPIGYRLLSHSKGLISVGMTLLLSACSSNPFTSIGPTEDSGVLKDSGSAGVSATGGTNQTDSGMPTGGSSGGGTGAFGGTGGLGGTAGNGGTSVIDSGLDAGRDAQMMDSGIGGTAPSLVRPADESLRPPKSAFLYWEGGTVPPGKTIAGYRFCWSDQGLASIQAGCPNEQLLTQPAAAIDPLSPNSRIFWKVQNCYDDQGSDCGEFNTPWTLMTDNSVVLRANLNDGLINPLTTIALDSSPFATHGTLQNFDLPTAWTDGEANSLVSGALLFDGSDDFINYGDILNFDSSSSFSFDAWVNRTAIGTIMTIGGRQDLAEVVGIPGYWLGFDSDNSLWFELSSNSTNNDVIDVKTVDKFDVPNTPMTIAATYDGSSLASGVSLYVNAVNQAVSVPFDSLTGTILNSAPFRIGSTLAYGGAQNSTENNLAGIIGDFTMYNRVLSQQENEDIHCARELLNNLPLSSICYNP